MKYDNLSEETRAIIENKNYSELANEQLIELLDDIAQILAAKSNEQWNTDRSKEHKAFTSIKRELYNRLCEVK